MTLRISNILLFAWLALWTATHFLEDGKASFATFFDFAALAIGLAGLPFLVLGAVRYAAQLFVVMNGVATFVAATALVAFFHDPQLGDNLSRLQIILTASAPPVVAMVWGSYQDDIQASAQDLRQRGNLASADPVRVVLAAVSWIIVPLVYASTYGFQVQRLLFEAGLCAGSNCDGEGGEGEGGEGEGGGEWSSACECSLFYLRHLAIISVTIFSYNLLLLLELLKIQGSAQGTVLVP